MPLREALILRNLLRLKRLTYLLLIPIMLAGCTERSNDDDGGYHVISDGTSVKVDEPDTDSSEEYSCYIPEGMETVYASRYLDDEKKEVYDNIVKSIAGFEESVPLEIDAEIYNMLLNLANIEQLSFSHIENRRLGDFDVNTQTFSVEFDYRFTEQEVSDMNRASEKAADAVLEGITEDMSEYDILKYFHDYLILNCNSDTEDIYANTVYGALVKGKALCEGYSKAFSYLCNRAGIENMIVTGNTGVAHMWNMVNVDGNWYHIDVTLDKPMGQLAEMYPDMVLYQYFMVTNSVIENDHVIWNVGTEPPKAYSKKENYYIKEGFYITEETDINSAIENALSDAVENKRGTASVRFDSNNVMISAFSLLKEGQGGNDHFKDMIDDICKEYDVGINVGWTDYYAPYRILVFVIDYT